MPPQNMQQPNGYNPYHFITQPEAPKPGNRFLPNPNTTKGRILVVAGGVVVLLIIAMVVVSLLSGSGQNGKDSLASVAAHQQELIRITDLGVKTAKNPDTRNLAITTNLTASSDQQRLLTQLKKSRTTVSKSRLLSRKNPATDASFTQAAQTDQFDETFTKTLDAEIASYQRSIKTAYDANDSKVTRALLTSEMQNAQALLGSATAQSN